MYNGEKQEMLWFYAIWKSIFILVEDKEEATLLGKEGWNALLLATGHRNTQLA